MVPSISVLSFEGEQRSAAALSIGVHLRVLSLLTRKLASVGEGRVPDRQPCSHMLIDLVVMVVIVSETVPEQSRLVQWGLKVASGLALAAGVYLDKKPECVRY